MPYVQQWNLGFGFQLGNNYGLEVNYVGNKSTNLFGPSQVFNPINLAEYSREFQAGLNMTQQIPNPQGITGANGQVIMVTRQNSLRPLSTLGDITDPLEQGFDARYNALQINLTKRFSLRLSVQRELHLDEGDGRQFLHGPVLRQQRHSELGQRLAATLRRFSQPGEIDFGIRHPEHVPLQLQLGPAGRTGEAVPERRPRRVEPGDRELETQRQWRGAKR